jgi:hypothetical protein
MDTAAFDDSEFAAKTDERSRLCARIPAARGSGGMVSFALVVVKRLLAE